jgi:hypothetical protein
MRTMCVEISHRFYPRARRVFVRHSQNQIHERGNGLAISRLLLRGDGANAADGVVARYSSTLRHQDFLKKDRKVSGIIALRRHQN